MIMFRLGRLSIFFLTMLFVHASSSSAELSGALTITNDYVWRGYSKSNGEFSWQTNLDYEHQSGIYFGVSASTIDFGNDLFINTSKIEITPYIGWGMHFNQDWRMDLQWNRYIYDKNLYGQYSDYNELYLFLHYRDLVTFRASFSENYYYRNHTAGDFELTTRYPINDWLEFSASAGYSLLKEAIEYDYFFWNIGATAYFEYLVIDLRVMDAYETAELSTDHQEEPDSYPETLETTLVFSVSVGF